MSEKRYLAAVKDSETIEAGWLPPDAEHLFLRGDGTWEHMMLIPQTPEEFAALSWSEIEVLANLAAKDPEPFSHMVSDTPYTKADTFGTYGEQSVTLVGIAHDDLGDGSGKAGFTFQATDAWFTRRMNDAASTSGGWPAMELRKFLNSDGFLGQLPADLRTAIKPVKKLSYGLISGNRTNPKGENLKESIDSAFVASACENMVVSNDGGGYYSEGANVYPVVTGEGTTYEYWQNHRKGSEVIKKYQGNYLNYWTRSISPTRPANCRFITGQGSLSYGLDDVTYQSGCVVPCFCIGRAS